MKILIACEYSGVVRDAFLAMGHDAMSCDILPTESPGPHYQGDVMDIINNGWDMMIAHPPCTHLAVSGARWFKDKRVEQGMAIEFFMTLVTAWIHKMPPGPEREKERSRTFAGIAEAMAEQWG